MEASLADKQPRADKLLKVGMHSFFESWCWEGLTSHSRLSEPGVLIPQCFHSQLHLSEKIFSPFFQVLSYLIAIQQVCKGHSHCSYKLLCYLWSHANRGSNNPATAIPAVSAYLRLFIALAVAWSKSIWQVGLPRNSHRHSHSLQLH